MASHHSLFVFLLLNAILLLSYSAKSDDANDKLLQGINAYRVSLNLSTLVVNKNAECLADQISEQLKDQNCTNTTGTHTVPVGNYPKLLDHCHLNATVTRDGTIMPACIPDLVPGLVLTNFTRTKYTLYLNDSKYSGVGIASEDNWIVTVLTTNTSTGSFENTSGSVSIVGLHLHLLPLLLGFLVVLIS
ncbi:putative GPI-anchored protein At5g19250 [Tasmannia lanceolata]|uniref:putative GPI-anchored protein At5g19250 n=1 Tax=Tasmannia lanceolata TaxID=3420 RepID=UPI004064793E